MLNHLVIKNFAIIEDIEINFNEGMNCILGETGAGKSIIIDALSLLKGEKSSFDKIRNGESKAFIEGEFTIEDKAFIDEINEEYGDIIESDGVLTVSRTLDINNKSTVRINFHVVPLTMLKKVMEHIIDIHSQHKDNAFFDNKKQIYFLDAYEKKVSKNKNASLFDNYAKLYKTYLSESKKLEEMLEKASSFEDLDYLQFQYDELEKANVQENELEDVESELKSLESFQELASHMQEYKASYEEASGLLYNSKKSLSSVKDDNFEEMKEEFVDLYYKLDEVHEKIISKFNELESGLEHLEYLRARRSVLLSLKRKYGKTTQDILNKFEEIKEEIDLITNYDYVISKQKEIIEKAKLDAYNEAKKISNVRKNVINVLQKEVNVQLHDLLLENADFRIEQNEVELNKNGIDEILFTLRANMGGKYLTLANTASLGETSRIHLALKNVFNNLEPVGTIIFDEIDTGISGRVAIATAFKIKDISKSSQTIVISHLPQMAASSNYHYFVSKVVENKTTKTKVRELNEEDKVIEIAKMITGDEVNEESLKLASNLIDQMNN